MNRSRSREPLPSIIAVQFAERQRWATRGAGAPRAAWRNSVCSAISIFLSIARGVTAPRVGSGDLFGSGLIGLEYERRIIGKAFSSERHWSLSPSPNLRAQTSDFPKGNFSKPRQRHARRGFESKSYRGIPLTLPSTGWVAREWSNRSSAIITFNLAERQSSATTTAGMTAAAFWFGFGKFIRFIVR